MPAILQRPHAVRAQAPSPEQYLAEPARPDPGGLIAGHLTRRRGNARGGVRALCMSAPSMIIKPGPLLLAVEVDGRRTRLAGGAATLLSSHAGHPRPATSDKAKGSQAPPGRQPQ